MKTTNIVHLWRNWSSWKRMIGQSFRSTWKKLHSAEFYQAPAQQPVGNGKRSNFVVQIKTHVGCNTPTRTTHKNAKSPTKQPLHKLPICPANSIKDRLKKLSPIRPEQLKQKSQAPISQTAQIQMPSRTKSPVRIKLCNALGSTKSLQRTYSIESMDSDTDCVVACLDLEEIMNNYNTWKHLTVDKLISSPTFLDVNLSYHTYLFKCVQTDDRF